MANKAAIAKNKKQQIRVKGGSTKFKSVKLKNRCQVCGRSRGYIGRFKMCRICFRKAALNGELPGVRKMSW
jgi:small subunit ribosomal protein S14